MKQDTGLEQAVKEATRRNNCLDVIFTNQPSLVKGTEVVACVSDHAAVSIEAQVQAQHAKPARRHINLWSKANLEELRKKPQAHIRRNSAMLHQLIPHRGDL